LDLDLDLYLDLDLDLDLDLCRPGLLASACMSAKMADTTRPRGLDSKKVHIADTPLTHQNWYKHVNWLNVVLIVGIPLYGCVQALWVPLQFPTAVWAVVYYFFTGLGITAGTCV
jgi:stearoyl-CoA desaturase (Delta-9 desaturase)